MSTKKTAKSPEELQAALQALIAQGKKDGMVRAEEVNAILLPIISECDGWSGDLGWYQVRAPFAVANIVWTNNGFVIEGAEV